MPMGSWPNNTHCPPILTLQLLFPLKSTVRTLGVAAIKSDKC